MAGAMNLEDQLRSMILGNVTIDSNQKTDDRASRQESGGRSIRRGGRRGRELGEVLDEPRHHERVEGNGQPRYNLRSHSYVSSQDTSRQAIVPDGPRRSHAQGFGRGHSRGQSHGRDEAQGQFHTRRHNHNQESSEIRQLTGNIPHVSDHQHQHPHHGRGHHHHHDRGYGRGRWHDGGQRGYSRGFARRGAAPSKFVPLERNGPSFFERQQNQGMFLEKIASQILPDLDMSPEEWTGKETFRKTLEKLCQDAIQEPVPSKPPIELAAFGSFSSGFAMPGSDMDLALVTSELFAELPRILEKVVLNAGYGARLLSRTRVPILKICEKPSEQLRQALLDEREKWDNMTPEEQASCDGLGPAKLKEQTLVKEPQPAPLKIDGPTPAEATNGKPEQKQSKGGPRRRQRGPKKADAGSKTDESQQSQQDQQDSSNPVPPPPEQPNIAASTADTTPDGQEQNNEQNDHADDGPPPSPRPRQPRPWFREKRLGPLDFPKEGVGVQCDINFSTQLGIHNTALLRCYSFCDIRVRLMVLFVKSWASRRKVNNSRSGTLSSYGYVLMVLHFLVNVASPPVCPNLQLAQLERENYAPPSPNDPLATCDGYDIRFWRNEAELQARAAQKSITSNTEPLGHLLRQFFQYYAHQHHDAPRGGFVWTRDVLSLRSPRGLLSKADKGWTGARTTTQDNAEVRHRYLFAIEDPFELDHNVARTVTHNGIVAIRDEFRRAWKLIAAAGNELRANDGSIEEGLMDIAIDDMPVRGDVRGDKDAEDLKVAAEQDSSAPATTSSNVNTNESGADGVAKVTDGEGGRLHTDW